MRLNIWRTSEGNFELKATPGVTLDGSRGRDGSLTIACWEVGLLVNLALHPAHQVLDVGRCWHLCRALKVLIVLPQVLEPVCAVSISSTSTRIGQRSYSSVAFISGHDWGEQNSVIDP